MLPRPRLLALAEPHLARKRPCCPRTFVSSRPSAGAPTHLRDLPSKVELEVAPMGRFSKLVPPRRGREVIQRVGSTYGGTHSLAWVAPPKTVLFVAKKSDARTLLATKKILSYISEARPELTIIVEEEVYRQLGDVTDNILSLQPYDVSLLPSRVDFVIALGGDGTMLRVSSMFDGGAVPPVLGISMGSLGFMMPVHLEAFPAALNEVLESRASMLLRMRLQCVVHQDGEPVHTNAETSTVHAMNEVALHRGPSSHLIWMNTFVDQQFLTEVVADGLLISTPTGSTAYSLSAGGPIVHPSVQSLLLTAVSPRSLSFRTVLLPSDVCVNLNLSSRSRGPAQLSLDGHEVRTLLPSQTLSISMSPFPVPCISRPLSRLPTNEDNPSKEADEWILDIRRMLRFNAPFLDGRSDANLME